MEGSTAGFGDRCRRLCGQPGRRGASRPAHPMWIWYSARKPCIACRTCSQSCAAESPRRGRRVLPRDRKIRLPCPHRMPRVRAPLYRSWKAVPNIAAYCVVPYTRGEEVSRPFDDILAEVAASCRSRRARNHPSGTKCQCLPWIDGTTEPSPTSIAIDSLYRRRRLVSRGFALLPAIRWR
jgi:hypothetical protein